MPKHDNKHDDKHHNERKEHALKEFLKRQPPETEKRLRKALKAQGLWHD